MNDKLLDRINKFYDLAIKYAAAPEFVALRNKPNFWFSGQMAKDNTEKYFASFDKDNTQAIINLVNKGLLHISDSYTENLYHWYAKHPKIQGLMNFIISSFNKYFPNLDAKALHTNLINDGTLNADLANNEEFVASPIFILMHDLIHNVLEPEFLQSLEQQKEQKKQDENAQPSLHDELNEDIAASLSNFQPILDQGRQGLWHYIKQLFFKTWNAKEPLNPNTEQAFEEKIKKVIEETFRHAKAELRGKLNGVKKISPATKQLVDGILSKTKHQMMQRASEVAVRGFEYEEINPSEGIKWGYRFFGLAPLSKEYNQKIMESKIINQPDSSAMRAWMLECLAAMKPVHDYFTRGLEQDLVAGRVKSDFNTEFLQKRDLERQKIKDEKEKKLKQWQQEYEALFKMERELSRTEWGQYKEKKAIYDKLKEQFDEKWKGYKPYQ